MKRLGRLCLRSMMFIEGSLKYAEYPWIICIAYSRSRLSHLIQIRGKLLDRSFGMNHKMMMIHNSISVSLTLNKIKWPKSLSLSLISPMVCYSMACLIIIRFKPNELSIHYSVIVKVALESRVWISDHLAQGYRISITPSLRSEANRKLLDSTQLQLHF